MEMAWWGARAVQHEGSTKGPGVGVKGVQEAFGVFLHPESRAAKGSRQGTCCCWRCAMFVPPDYLLSCVCLRSVCALSYRCMTYLYHSSRTLHSRQRAGKGDLAHSSSTDSCALSREHREGPFLSRLCRGKEWPGCRGVIFVSIEGLCRKCPHTQAPLELVARSGWGRKPATSPPMASWFPGRTLTPQVRCQGHASGSHFIDHIKNTVGSGAESGLGFTVSNCLCCPCPSIVLDVNSSLWEKSLGQAREDAGMRLALCVPGQERSPGPLWCWGCGDKHLTSELG